MKRLKPAAPESSSLLVFVALDPHQGALDHDTTSRETWRTPSWLFLRGLQTRITIKFILTSDITGSLESGSAPSEKC